MRPIPSLIPCACLAVTVACGPREAENEATRGIPFARPVSGDSFTMISNTGDTVRFSSELLDGDRVRLVRQQSSPAGSDSLSVTVDAGTLTPLSSHVHRSIENGALIADIEYGAGFGGQARLTFTTPAGESGENLRTPPPLLDMAQIPQSFASLEMSRPDTFTFNFIAPFERRALNAQVVIGGRESVPAPGGSAAAVRLSLRVSGLEERYWFSAPPGEPRLLLWHEVTRGITWTRIGGP